MEDFLMNYGVLGLWTITLLYDRQKSLNSMKLTINNNTKAINHVSNIIKKCKKN
jgi:hypothetical protein